jgi:ubiquinol-cytochrome c reductase cytochrome c1 subunit
MSRVGKFPTGFPEMKCLVYICLFFVLHDAQAMREADRAELQRGAAVFMNYCAGCHSLKYMRPDQIMGNAYPTKISMPAVDAQQWFGRMPPDLSLIARQRGSEWLYHFLTGFYADKTRPFGVNNNCFPNVAMPDVLTPTLRNEDVHAVVSFLVYAAEPARMIRYQAGVMVMVFLVVLGAFVYRLKVMYWR